MVAALRFTAGLFGAVAAFAAAADEYFEGNGTSYILEQVSSGDCNFVSAIPWAPNNYVALNDAQWDRGGTCGRCIEVSCIDEMCTVKNKKAVVQVLDSCAKCPHGALDLSSTVFKEITGLGPYLVTPTNSVVGVKSVTVNGGATTMLDGAYYYVSTTSNTYLSAVKVAVTSSNGEVISISGLYSLSAGNCTDTKKQFVSGSGDDTSAADMVASSAEQATL
ncbi:RxLR-like protein [Phytophthora cinnamomi]|uniref:RxLR-like protein n=1 Tax=Phytophthora cinnamomi TaxID=4785 RepID=UPI003559CB23|nr:RxLR-like protein [Phytophthora cinnamomi]